MTAVCPADEQCARRARPVRECAPRAHRVRWRRCSAHHTRSLRRRPAPGGERGAATAEFALALPAVVTVLVAVLLVTSASLTQVRVADAARAGARAVALGEIESDVRSLAVAIAGDSAEIGIGRAGEFVEVTVARPVPGPLGWIDVTARAQAVARPEPGS